MKTANIQRFICMNITETFEEEESQRKVITNYFETIINFTFFLLFMYMVLSIKINIVRRQSQ